MALRAPSGSRGAASRFAHCYCGAGIPSPIPTARPRRRNLELGAVPTLSARTLRRRVPTLHAPLGPRRAQNLAAAAPAARPPDSTTQHPGRTRPCQTRPDQSRLDPPRPGQTTPDQTCPGQVKPDPTKPSQTRPNQTTPDQARPNQTRPSQAKPAQPEPGQPRPDPTWPSRIKPDYGKNSFVRAAPASSLESTSPSLYIQSANSSQTSNFCSPHLAASSWYLGASHL